MVHKEFTANNVHNDIALIVLKSPVKLSAHVSTICLPPKNAKFDKDLCFASGWGSDDFGSKDKYRVNLKKLELPVVPLKDCQSRLRTTKLGMNFKLHPSFMCAGGALGVDACIGDGGSPLVCPIPDEENYYYQAGVVSWGVECGHEGIPGVYASVSKFREFIDESMKTFGFGSQSYSFNANT